MRLHSFLDKLMQNILFGEGTRGFYERQVVHGVTVNLLLVVRYYVTGRRQVRKPKRKSLMHLLSMVYDDP